MSGGGAVLVDLATGIVEIDIGSGLIQVELVTMSAQDDAYAYAHRASIHGLGSVFEVITPHDTNLIKRYKYIVVGAAGTVICVDASASPNTVTFTCQAGAVLQCRPHIIKTGGTATPIIGVIE